MTRFPACASRVLLALLLGALLLSSIPQVAKAQGPRVLLADIDDAIDRSTLDYLLEALNEAQQGGFAALVLRFDTPGGGLDETEAMSAAMMRSTVPVLGWVGPVGAHAWSAGTILLESTDLAAMAIGTTTGSVQPVVLGPGGFEPVTDEKIIGAIVGSLREKMVLHGRNDSLADRFVRDNLNLNASQAVDLGATELVAGSVPEFLALADGFHTVYKGLTLSVAGAEIVSFAPSIRVGFLALLSDPLVASLLLILGIYALIFGLSAPGHGAEIGGVIILLLALIGLGFSVDPIALLLIVIGVILMIVEVKTPGFGVFGVGGIVAIILGAVFVAPLRPPEFVVSPEYQILFLVALLTPTAAFGVFLLFALYKVLEIRRRKPAVGAMVGETATVVEAIPSGEKGYVQYQGELWQAVPDADVPAGATVFIHEIDGIVARVSPHPPPAPEVPTWRRLWDRFLGRDAASRGKP